MPHRQSAGKHCLRNYRYVHRHPEAGFISGGLTHASFGGIGLGLYADFTDSVGSGLFRTVGIRRGMAQQSGKICEDSAIAVFWTLGMALASYSHSCLPVCAILSGLPVREYPDHYQMATSPCWDWQHCSSLSSRFPASDNLCGIRPRIRPFAKEYPYRPFEYVLMMFIALTIVACLRMVGIVLVISLLTIPQMTANLFSHRFHRIIWLSVGIGYLSCLGGLLISYYLNVPSRGNPSSSSPLLFMQSVREKVFGYLCRKKRR